MQLYSYAVQKIEQVVNEVEILYQSCQGLILSESDLKCILYHKLYNYFGTEKPTIDENISGISLHTEVAFFDENDKLVFKPDIVLIDPKSMSILNSRNFKVKVKELEKLPSKGFIFGGNAIIVELKFCRNKTGITPARIRKYEKDVEKIRKIQIETSRRTDGNKKVLGFLIIFNKTDKYKRDFDRFVGQENNYNNLKIIYKTGKVSWDNT